MHQVADFVTNLSKGQASEVAQQVTFSVFSIDGLAVGFEFLTREP